MGDYSTNLRTQYLNARTHTTNRRTIFENIVHGSATHFINQILDLLILD